MSVLQQRLAVDRELHARQVEAARAAAAVERLGVEAADLRGRVDEAFLYDLVVVV